MRNPDVREGLKLLVLQVASQAASRTDTRHASRANTTSLSSQNESDLRPDHPPPSRTASDLPKVKVAQARKVPTTSLARFDHRLFAHASKYLRVHISTRTHTCTPFVWVHTRTHWHTHRKERALMRAHNCTNEHARTHACKRVTLTQEQISRSYYVRTALAARPTPKALSLSWSSRSNGKTDLISRAMPRLSEREHKVGPKMRQTNMVCAKFK